MVGRSMHDTIHHTHADGIAITIIALSDLSAFRDGSVHKVDTEVFWRKDGEPPLWVEYDLDARFANVAASLGAVIVFRDITLRRESEDSFGALEEVDQLATAAGAGERISAGGDWLGGESGHRGIIGKQRGDTTNCNARSIWSRKPTQRC